MTVLLALDTATEACSVALAVEDRVWHRFEVAGRRHSEWLPRMVAAVLAESGISLTAVDRLACGIGPGSFAGVRIGVAYAKGLALGLGRPVVGVSSLAMLAQGAFRHHGAAHVVTLIDARMNEVYHDRFVVVDGIARSAGPAGVMPPDAVPWVDFGDDAAVAAVGTGLQAHEAVLRSRFAGGPRWLDAAALPDARDAVPLAHAAFAAGAAGDAARLTPLYLRNRVALTRQEQAAARAQHTAPPGA